MNKSSLCIECGKAKEKKLYAKNKDKYCSRKCALIAFKRSRSNQVPHTYNNWISHRVVKMVEIAGKLREVTCAR